MRHIYPLSTFWILGRLANVSATVDVVVVRPFQPNALVDVVVLSAECYVTKEDEEATPQDCCNLVANAVSDTTMVEPCLDAIARLSVDIGSSHRLPSFMSTFQGGSLDEGPIALDTINNRLITDPRELVDLQLYSSQYHVKSGLSPVGGMHRQLNVHVAMDQRRNPYAPACVFLPIYIPKGLFVNVEDVFVTSSDTTISLDLVRPVPNIDQEEPSFASQPYATAIQICNTTETVVAFGMQYHSRYPEPCHDGATTTPVSWSLHETWLDYTVACPNSGDYNVIVSMCVVASLLGAVVSLHNVASVSLWI